MTTTAWTRAHLAMIAERPLPALPVIAPADCPSIGEGLWYWDFWPAETVAGAAVTVGPGELWFALAAPIGDDPEARHATARIRRLLKSGTDWRDLGPAVPKGFTPGSREWSGSAIVEGTRLTLYFTAAGRRDEAALTYEQRIFSCSAEIDVRTGHIGSWSTPEECFAADGLFYEHACETAGSIGMIKAFRDPAYVRDPNDGTEYILFTASVAGSASAYCGCVGVARRDGDRWTLLPPLITADAVNNELERPHLRWFGGRAHLFWSTQSHVFAPDVPKAPTGVYAMTSEAVLGPYLPFASSGLVACNPGEAPLQAYSWWVSNDGCAISFADRVAGDQNRRFLGKPAPSIRLEVGLIQ